MESDEQQTITNIMFVDPVSYSAVPGHLQVEATGAPTAVFKRQVILVLEDESGKQFVARFTPQVADALAHDLGEAATEAEFADDEDLQLIKLSFSFMNKE